MYFNTIDTGLSSLHYLLCFGWMIDIFNMRPLCVATMVQPLTPHHFSSNPVKPQLFTINYSRREPPITVKAR